MTPIPVEDLPGYTCPVHVEGWKRGCVFFYKETRADGAHVLVTPKTRRVFLTRRRLCYTNRNDPNR